MGTAEPFSNLGVPAGLHAAPAVAAKTRRCKPKRLLAQSTLARSPSLSDVPTYQEAGVKGLVLDQWLGVFVPAGTPAAIITRLNTEMNRALGEATIRESFLQSTQEPVGGSAEQFSRLIREDFDKYGRLVNELNIRVN